MNFRQKSRLLEPTFELFQKCYDTQARADTTIYMLGCRTKLCTGQLSPDICCRRAKNAKWSQNVSTREGPVLSGPGPATATRHSTKNIWNWSVKNLVNYVELYICIYLKTKALIGPQGFTIMHPYNDLKHENRRRLSLPLGSIHRQLFVKTFSASTNQELESCYWRTQIFAEL